jgi:hypothetical protein
MHQALKPLSLVISQELFPSHLSETYPYFSCSQWCHLHQVHCSESKHSSCQNWKRMHTISNAGLLTSVPTGHSESSELVLHIAVPPPSELRSCDEWKLSREQCLMATQSKSHSFGKKENSVFLKGHFINCSFHTYN